MSTIMIVAIAACAFLVIFSIITFVVWKRESTRRTNSIKGIERRLKDVRQELSEIANEIHNAQKQAESIMIKSGDGIAKAEINLQSEVEKEDIPEEPDLDNFDLGEIDLDIINELMKLEKNDNSDIDDEINILEGVAEPEDIDRLPNEYITGRSGRRYTAEELETLIKE